MPEPCHRHERSRCTERAEKRAPATLFATVAYSPPSLVAYKLLKGLEARVGIEPTHKGFADLSLTTWVPRLLRACAFTHTRLNEEECIAGGLKLERETGVEPATSSLARRCSTTELLPLGTLRVYRQGSRTVNATLPQDSRPLPSAGATNARMASRTRIHSESVR